MGEQFDVGGIRCHLHSFGASDQGVSMPLFVMPYAGDPADTLVGQHERLDPETRDGTTPPLALLIFETRDWNGDLSPWPAPAIRRGEADFAGNARQTLDWILADLLPAARARVPGDGPLGILGYSMAGLFALWAMYQTDAFAVCASCSGSLWYEGFADYTARHAIHPCSVYLSLGEREEKTRHPLFSRIGDVTRDIAARLAASDAVQDTTLVWQPGGHLGAVGGRLADALRWMATAARR